MTAEHKCLRDLQLEQYKMLQFVNEICVKHDISFYLVYGTLLGAVRHSKSIPWDYDIDIAMEREAFNRFRTYVQEFPEWMKLWDICYSSIEYAGLSRVVKPGDSRFGDIHIDIFVLDFARETSKVHRKMNGILCRFLQIAKLSKSEKAILYEHFQDSKGKQFVVFLGALLCKLFTGARIERWIYHLLVSNKQTNQLVILEDPDRPMKREWFSELQMLRYEDSSFPAPNGYECLLKLWYGDYMEIPEEGKKYLREEQAEEV